MGDVVNLFPKVVDVFAVAQERDDIDQTMIVNIDKEGALSFYTNCDDLAKVNLYIDVLKMQLLMADYEE